MNETYHRIRDRRAQFSMWRDLYRQRRQSWYWVGLVSQALFRRILVGIWQHGLHEGWEW